MVAFLSFIYLNPTIEVLMDIKNVKNTVKKIISLKQITNEHYNKKTKIVAYNYEYFKKIWYFLELNIIYSSVAF